MLLLLQTSLVSQRAKLQRIHHLGFSGCRRQWQSGDAESAQNERRGLLIASQQHIRKCSVARNHSQNGRCLIHVTYCRCTFYRYLFFGEEIVNLESSFHPERKQQFGSNAQPQITVVRLWISEALRTAVEQWSGIDSWFQEKYWALNLLCLCWQPSWLHV